MSHKVTTLVYSRKAGSSHRKAVLAYMADRASDDGSGVWASKKTIADEIECGRSTVIKICNEFVSEGVLVPTGTRKCANGATVEYAINLEAVRALPSIKASTSGTSPDLYQSTSGTPPVHQRDPKASTSGTQTTSQPSMNQDTKVSLSPSDLSKHFEDFWAAFPHRNGKKTKKDEAKPLFIKAIKAGACVSEIANGVENMHRDPDVGRGYGRGPVPWLRQRGWTDEIPDTPPQFRTITGGQDGSGNRNQERHRSLADEIAAAARAR